VLFVVTAPHYSLLRMHRLQVFTSIFHGNIHCQDRSHPHFYAGVRPYLDPIRSACRCHVKDEVIAFNLPRLPREDPVFVFGDGGRSLSPALTRAVQTDLKSRVVSASGLAEELGLKLSHRDWPSLQLAVCSAASSLMLNRYSPVSALVRQRANAIFAAEGAEFGVGQVQAASRVLWWSREQRDLCIPLFQRTARFDIQPNSFGILGQFGPERKLQLQMTNVSSLIGWDGKVIPSASIELEVYISNTTHPLSIFEYTKENNAKGLTFTLKPPEGGWTTHTWHSLVLPITDRSYSFPRSTPWDAMDRLELYYGNPSPLQQHGDYVRIRNVYIRSTSTHSADGADGVFTGAELRRPCKELTTLFNVTSSSHPMLGTSRVAATQLGRKAGSGLVSEASGSRADIATNEAATPFTQATADLHGDILTEAVGTEATRKDWILSLCMACVLLSCIACFAVLAEPRIIGLLLQRWRYPTPHWPPSHDRHRRNVVSS